MGISDNNFLGWETSDFPILCETCLGSNPYVRMTKQNYGTECKICTNPFTVFRWCPGKGMRFKKTEICQLCSKLKNVCQTCILDLQYSLPVQVRDSVLGIKDTTPKLVENRNYFYQNIADRLENEQSLRDYTKDSLAGKEFIKTMARHEPYYKRNLPHYCSFYLKGECTRGDECPYRHEIPVENGQNNQNIKDRYNGENDPVAGKILRNAKFGNLKPPTDKSITSLFLIGITEDIKEQDLKNFFYSFGEIKSIIIVKNSKCAFINYVLRESAEDAAKMCYNLRILDHPIRVSWGKPRPLGPNSEVNKSRTDLETNFPPLPPSSDSAKKYTSQDPTMQGSYFR